MSFAAKTAPGKSTFMKIVNGLYPPDSGEIWIDGERVHVNNPIEARAHGISMISQELNYIPEITVEEALFLGIEPLNRMRRIDWPQIRERTIALLRSEGLNYNPRTKLKDLSVSDVQMIEIMKAVSQQANIIIMDEPTSAISAKEVEILFAKIADLKTKGAAIIYISHRLDELFRIADDLTVIRDGTHVATRAAKDFTVDSVIQLMVGRSIGNVFPPRPERRFGPTALEVAGLSDGEKFRDVDFQHPQWRNCRLFRAHGRRPQRGRPHSLRSRSRRRGNHPHQGRARGDSGAPKTA